MTDLKYFNVLRIGLKDDFKKLWLVFNKYKKFEHIYSRLPEVLKELDIKRGDIWDKLDVDKEYEKIINSNTKIILFDDKNYPKLLKEIYSPPLGLYIRGSESCFNSNHNLAVIGSRKSTDYGRRATEKITKDLKDSNITIVSGLALGIDSYAHKCALENGLKTIGIIGSGFNYFFPSENIELAKSIVKNNGLVVSEYPLDFKPEKYYFPARNRIISGISKGVLIVEAQKKSGTLITAKFAEEQNRDIYAIPNNIFEKNSCGTNILIKDGAKLIDSGDDILLDMNLKI